MKIQQAITNLQNLTDTRITYEQIANSLNISTQAISNRVSRSVDLKDFEIKKIEDFFNVSFSEKKLNDTDSIQVDYYTDVFGSCGTGVFVLSEKKQQIAVSKKIIENFNENKKYSVINASGDSMQPYIYDNDKLLIEHWGGEQIRDNKVYVFRYGNNIFVKRLVLNINKLVIKSDNKEYSPVEIELKDADIQIIGQIVGLMRDMG